MSHIRLPDLALGTLEQAVLEALWRHGPLNPKGAHAQVGVARGISVNTVSSALKRLWGKGLLTREKVSHAYVYTAAITQAELQRHLIQGVAERFGGPKAAGLLAAFVDVAEAGGEAQLRELEALIAARLAERTP